MFSWAPIAPIFAAFSLALLGLSGCKKPWMGKYASPGFNDCMLLEYVEVYPDRSADVKYLGLRHEANFPAYFREEDSVLIILELNKEWFFKWKGNDTLFEISNIDPYCFLVKSE
jgi:hypothetical protein